MSGNVNIGRDREDEDIEVGDRDRHRRTAQTDRARSSSPKSKKFRQTDQNSTKELINEFTVNSPDKSLRKDKSNSGSKELDNLYASYLPSSDFYEKSYMHRDILTHLIVTSTDFLISGSQDGHIKFWKILTPDYIKQQQQSAAACHGSKNNDEKDPNSLITGPIEFVKHFRAHLGQSLLLLLFIFE